MSVVQFFFDRFHRAIQMDGVHSSSLRNQLDADEWIQAYKNTLSKNQLDKFDKEWAKCEEALRLARRKADFGK